MRPLETNIQSNDTGSVPASPVRLAQWVTEKMLSRTTVTLQGMMYNNNLLPEQVESGVHHAARSAQVDFPVNIAVIDPNFNSNRKEIALMDGTLDSLKANKNIVIPLLFFRLKLKVFNDFLELFFT